MGLDGGRYGGHASGILESYPVADKEK
jgi:hypothetical protein